MRIIMYYNTMPESVSLPGDLPGHTLGLGGRFRNASQSGLIGAGIYAALATALFALGLTVWLVGSGGLIAATVTGIAWAGSAFLTCLASRSVTA